MKKINSFGKNRVFVEQMYTFDAPFPNKSPLSDAHK